MLDADVDVDRWLCEIDRGFWILNFVVEDCICENYEIARKAYDKLLDIWPAMTDRERRRADTIFSRVLGHYLRCLQDGSGVKPGCLRLRMYRETCVVDNAPRK